MTDEDWKCCGCGKVSPDRERTCECPTEVVFRNGKTEWKRRPGAGGISQHCHTLIGTLFEKKPSRIRLGAEDIDLIKVALKEYAAQHS